MTIFPAQYSTLSSYALKDHIRRKYGLDVASCRLLLRGVSDTYQLEGDSCKYIFKVYRRAHRSLTEIKGEVELLNNLYANGAKVAFPLADKEGEQVQEFQAAEGVRHGVLFHFAKGKPVYDLANEQLQMIGREMAFNHTITSKIRLKNERKEHSLQNNLLRPLETLEPAFKEYPEGYAYLKIVAERVAEKLEPIPTADFGYGYCHYDYLPKNFHFDENNQLRVFDFDFAGKGLLANDLMSFKVHYFFHIIIQGMAKEEADNHFHVFVEGYREVRAVSEEELALIPYLGMMYWMFYLGFQYAHFEDWSNTFFGVNHLKKWIGWMKKWEELYCKF